MKATLLKSLFGVFWLLCINVGAYAIGYTTITINGKATVCKNSTATYSTPSPTAGISYTWTMSSPIGSFSTTYGASTTVLWASPGTTTLTLQGRNSSGTLKEQGTLAITVAPLPQPSISTSYRVGCQTFPDDTTTHEGPPLPTAPLFDDKGCPKVCEGSWVTYTASGAGSSTFTWTVSGGTAYPSGNTCLVNWGAIGIGNISVTETTADSCQGSKSVCIEIIGKPHARFGALPDTTLTSINICKNDYVIFVDHSYATSSSPIVDWYWDFGDGTTYSSSTSTNPTHQYTTPPNNYVAFLVVKNACNCTDTMWLNIQVNEMEGVKISCASVVCDSSHATYSLDNPGSLSCGSYDWSVMGG
ncbi:MAG: PKD domain-containing protein, partial [Chitinophagaceae bacterium]